MKPLVEDVLKDINDASQFFQSLVTLEQLVFPKLHKDIIASLKNILWISETDSTSFNGLRIAYVVLKGCLKNVLNDADWLIIQETFSNLVLLIFECIAKASEKVLLRGKPFTSFVLQITNFLLPLVFEKDCIRFVITLKGLPAMVRLISLSGLDVKTKKEIFFLFKPIFVKANSHQRKELVKNCYFELSKMAHVLVHCGDYQFQEGIIEILMRYSFSTKNKLAFWFQEHVKSTECFKLLDYHNFDITCREFLNKLNSSLETEARVITLPSVEAFVDDVRLKKPNTERYRELWVDFSTSTGCTHLVCDSDGTTWLKIIIEVHNVNKISSSSCSGKSSTFEQFVFELKNPLNINLYSTEMTITKVQLSFLSSSDLDQLKKLFIFQHYANVFEDENMPKVPSTVFPKAANLLWRRETLWDETCSLSTIRTSSSKNTVTKDALTKRSQSLTTSTPKSSKSYLSLCQVPESIGLENFRDFQGKEIKTNEFLLNKFLEGNKRRKSSLVSQQRDSNEDLSEDKKFKKLCIEKLSQSSKSLNRSPQYKSSKKSKKTEVVEIDVNENDCCIGGERDLAGGRSEEENEESPMSLALDRPWNTKPLSFGANPEPTSSVDRQSPQGEGSKAKAETNETSSNLQKMKVLFTRESLDYREKRNLSDQSSVSSCSSKTSSVKFKLPKMPPKYCTTWKDERAVRKSDGPTFGTAPSKGSPVEAENRDAVQAGTCHKRRKAVSTHSSLESSLSPKVLKVTASTRNTSCEGIKELAVSSRDGESQRSSGGMTEAECNVPTASGSAPMTTQPNQEGSHRVEHKDQASGALMEVGQQPFAQLKPNPVNPSSGSTTVRNVIRKPNFSCPMESAQRTLANPAEDRPKISFSSLFEEGNISNVEKPSNPSTPQSSVSVAKMLYLNKNSNSLEVNDKKCTEPGIVKTKPLKSPKLTNTLFGDPTHSATKVSTKRNENYASNLSDIFFLSSPESPKVFKKTLSGPNKNNSLLKGCNDTYSWHNVSSKSGKVNVVSETGKGRTFGESITLAGSEAARNRETEEQQQLNESENTLSNSFHIVKPTKTYQSRLRQVMETTGELEFEKISKGLSRGQQKKNATARAPKKRKLLQHSVEPDLLVVESDEELARTSKKGRNSNTKVARGKGTKGRAPVRRSTRSKKQPKYIQISSDESAISLLEEPLPYTNTSNNNIDNLKNPKEDKVQESKKQGKTESLGEMTEKVIERRKSSGESNPNAKTRIQKKEKPRSEEKEENGVQSSADEVRDMSERAELSLEVVPVERHKSSLELELEMPPLGLSPPVASRLSLSSPILPPCVSTADTSGTQAGAREEIEFINNIISRIEKIHLNSSRKKIVTEVSALERAIKTAQLFGKTENKTLTKEWSEVKKKLTGTVRSMERMMGSYDEFLSAFNTRMTDIATSVGRLAKDIEADAATKSTILEELHKISKRRLENLRFETFF